MGAAGRVLKLGRPSTRVTYELAEHDPTALPRLIAGAIERHKSTMVGRLDISHAAR